MPITANELLETLDSRGEPAGLVPRARVHQQGLWHRAAHVWVYDAAGHTYVQRRAPDKDLHPGCWDVSVGEHLQPGEDYRDAAARGLSEELGLHGLVLCALGPPRPIRVDRPERGVHDYEYQQAFTAVTSSHPVPAPDEVSALRLVAPDELRRWLGAAPEAFTPGFHHDVGDLGLP